EQGGAWHYAANRGGGRFAPSKVVAPVPAIAALAGGRQQLMDLAGDGAIELVEFGGPTPGFHERTAEGGWTRHVPFRSLPNIDWQGPNLRFLDLTGDGHADALISEHEVFTWYPSLEERGFGPARRQRQAAEETAGPRLVFNDGSQTLFLADMCGDGLTDLVRIRNGEVCWWPNLGYGRFGRKVSLANTPRFDAPDQFDPARIRLADIDGSGPTDLIYLGRSGAQLYLNRSGNSLSNGRLVPLPVATANLAAVQVADLLGTGTACLVWNSHLPADASHPVRFIDLMADGKPHLLRTVDNNLGATTTVEYTPSTRFYLDDLAAGRPWATRLPFPVHCVSRVTVADRHRRTRFSTSSTYHHGHFDGEEREFRGFGRVERLDVERFLPGPNVSDDQALVQPPVKTVSWFHTGLAEDRQRLLGVFEEEFFPARQPNRFGANGFRERVLPQPEVEAGGGAPLDGQEWREAMRACKGMLLREEVYELDLAALERGEHRPVRLFSAAHHNCLIRRQQPRGRNAHAVFLALESEALTYHYELDLRQANASADPRVAHSLQLRFDAYGRPEQSVAVVYPRAGQHQDGDLPADQLALIRQVQAEMHLAYSETRFTREIAPGLGHHRLPAVAEALTYELTGIGPSAGRYVSLDDLRAYRLSERLAGQGPQPVLSRSYQEPPATAAGPAARRLVEQVATLYARDDLGGPLPLGEQGRLGIVHETYKLALTASLLGDVLGARFDGARRGALNRPSADVWPNAAAGFLASGYQKGDQVLGAPTAEEQWWLRSGVAGYAADAAQHFYLPTRYRDPFGQLTSLSYDADDLYIASSSDAAGNRTAVTGFNHRVLAPTRLRDASGNESAMAYDIRGLPVAAALRGKVSAAGVAESGDDVASLSFEQLNPSEQAVAAFFAGVPLDGRQARQWLGKATSRFLYHFGVPPRAGAAPTAPGACSLQRERHERERPNQPGADPTSSIPLQMAFAYSDGSGQPLVSKAQAEPDPADPAKALRWIASGKTVLNNKGKPVKQFEPYFSSVGHRFEEPREEGVATTFTYDAPGRLVRTDFPDGTLARVVFTPWWSQAWDASDTVEEGRWIQSRNRLDPTSALPVRVDGLVDADPPQRAGWLARRHQGTPAQTHRDSLGREVIAIAHNRV
ncbi:MAG: toxin TcdB middle/N-terminal domain-containing protein, partial [Cyanobacteriota bacterium]